MKEFEEYLEKKGAKYFVTLLMMFYVVGTVIFNLYLRSLGFFEFELLKLRYIFVGVTFTLITSLPILGFLFLDRVYRNIKHNRKRRTKRQKHIFTQRLEIIFAFAIVPWSMGYSYYVLPEIPSGFGGARPVIARLVGEKESIKRINELIAFETGISHEKLALQAPTQDSELAIGANVKILDRNKDRILLILTKELYLRSTSNLAKNLIGEKDTIDFDTEETKNFKTKPLIVKADKIEGITLSLYEPPEVLTSDDLRVAAAVIAHRDEKQTEIVENIITEKSPETGPKVIAAVKETVKTSPPSPPVVTHPPTSAHTPDPPKVSKPSDEEIKQNVAAIETIFEEAFDDAFLQFRADIFHQAVNVGHLERQKGIHSSQRFLLVKNITEGFENHFPDAWKNLNPTNYLAEGQNEANFPLVVRDIFRGAENADQLIERINATPLPQKPVDSTRFEAIKPGALDLIDKSFPEDTDINRKYVSRVLSDYFNSKARNRYEYWNETKYLYSGRDDSGYIEKMRQAIDQSDSWESFGAALTQLHGAMNQAPEETESQPPETTPSEEPETPPDEISPVEETTNQPPEEDTPTTSPPTEEPSTEEAPPPSETTSTEESETAEETSPTSEETETQDPEPSPEEATTPEEEPSPPEEDTSSQEDAPAEETPTP